jgi:hypothetical protein
VKRPAIFIGALAISFGVEVAPSWATNWYVDPENGTDNATCGQSLAAGGPTSGPCATLNQALANANAGDNINITSSGLFGPIILTSAINIAGPLSGTAVIKYSGAPAGCIHAAPGNCGTATAGVEINDTNAADTSIELENVIASPGSGGQAAIHIANAPLVILENVSMHGNNSSTVALLYDQSATAVSGGVHSLLVYGGEVSLGSTVAGGIYMDTSVPTNFQISDSQIHHSKFGIKLNAAAITGGGLSANIDNEKMSNLTANGIVLNPGGQVTASISRSRLSGVGGVALLINSGASATLFENVITGNPTGVELANGGAAVTFGNNDIYFNSTNVTGGTLSGAPAISNGANPPGMTQ